MTMTMTEIYKLRDALMAAGVDPDDFAAVEAYFIKHNGDIVNGLQLQVEEKDGVLIRLRVVNIS